MIGHIGALLRPCSFRGIYGSRTAVIMYVSVDGFRKVNSDLRRVFSIQETSWKIDSRGIRLIVFHC